MTDHLRPLPEAVSALLECKPVLDLVGRSWEACVAVLNENYTTDAAQAELAHQTGMRSVSRPPATRCGCGVYAWHWVVGTGRWQCSECYSYDELENK